MALHSAVQIITGLVLLLSPGTPPAAEEKQHYGALTVELPHGGCRLTIFPDGSGNIHYGAAPGTVRVAARTFDFDRMLHLLQPDTVPRPARARGSDEVASIVLPGTSEAKPFKDAALVRNLLEQGWTSRRPPGAQFLENEERAHAWIRRTCDFN